MMVSALEHQGYRVWTVGDDIAWMQPGPDGYLHAINPEAGFFGVAPGTNEKTNPNVMAALRKNTIFTNTALTSRNEPWWEGMNDNGPTGVIDWQGRAWTGRTAPRHKRIHVTRCRRTRRPRFLALGGSRGSPDFPRSSLAAAARVWRRWCTKR